MEVHEEIVHHALDVAVKISAENSYHRNGVDSAKGMVAGDGIDGTVFFQVLETFHVDCDIQILERLFGKFHAGITLAEEVVQPLFVE